MYLFLFLVFLLLFFPPERLFPLQEPGMNYKAPPLTKTEIKVVKSHNHFKLNTRLCNSESYFISEGFSGK